MGELREHFWLIRAFRCAKLRQISGPWSWREIPVPIIDRLERGAVDRDAGLSEKAHRAAERDEPGADLADAAASRLGTHTER
jgi:hypothetical protein